MAEIKEKIYAEMENINKIIKELEIVKDRSNKELVVLMGIGGYLQNIYTGMENVLKQLLLEKHISLPQTPSWHKDLLSLSAENNIVSKETEDKMGKYLYFRHFFTHSYGFALEEEQLKPLVKNVFETYSEFKKEIEKYLSRLDK